MLKTDPSIEVIGTAINGSDALRKIAQLHPDVVTLDVEMPVMDGLETLKNIIRDNPLPVIMLSSLTQAETEVTINALQMGAVDFVSKPSGTISLDLTKVQDELIDKIKIAARVKLYRDVRREHAIDRSMSRKVISQERKKSLRKLVLIGTSTGGPKALNMVLHELPRDMSAVILIVQHMPPGFTRSLAERLNQISEIDVKEAEDQEEVVLGTAYIAPGDCHLIVEQSPATGELSLRLSSEAPVNGHRPSVDVMMQSAAKVNGWDLIGVILTGMGYDGREGIRALKDKDAITIAEDQKTAVVFGMPRVVIEAKLADYVLPLPLIAPEIVHLLNVKK